MKVTVVLLAACLAAVPFGAHAGPSSAIEGRVLDGEGRPVEKICVEAEGYKKRAFTGVPVFSAYTNSAGHYRISDLEAGIYQVRFFECLWKDAIRDDLHRFEQQWWPRQSDELSALPVPVGSGTTSGIDATLRIWSGITGRVTDEHGRPIEGVFVWANTLDGRGRFGSAGRTGPDGRYKILIGDGLSRWKISFESRIHQPEFGEYKSEWWDDRPDFASAKVVTHVPGSDTGGVDAALERTGTIKGKVTDASGAQINVCVEPYDSHGRLVTRTSEAGPYAIGGLATGSYKVFFRDCHLHGFGSRWYGGGTTFQSAPWITVVWGEATTGVDGALVRSS